MNAPVTLKVINLEYQYREQDMTKAKSFQLLNFNFPVPRIFSISTMDIYDVYQDLYAPLSSSPFGCNLLYGTADGDEEGDHDDDHGNCHDGNDDNEYDVGCFVCASLCH